MMEGPRTRVPARRDPNWARRMGEVATREGRLRTLTMFTDNPLRLMLFSDGNIIVDGLIDAERDLRHGQKLLPL